MNVNQLVHELDQLRRQIPSLKDKNARDPVFKRWRKKTEVFVGTAFPSDKGLLSEFYESSFRTLQISSDGLEIDEEDNKKYSRALEEADNALEAIIDKIKIGGTEVPAQKERSRSPIFLNNTYNTQNQSTSQTVNQSLDLTTVLNDIQNSSMTESQKAEVRSIVTTIMDEAKSGKPSWEKIMEPLGKLLAYKDVFMAIVSFLMNIKW